MPVQMHDRRGRSRSIFVAVWPAGRRDGIRLSADRGREGPKKFLGKWEGILQTDGYQAYEGVGGPKVVHVGCWAHARRKFVDAVKVNPRDAEAVNMVTRMDACFWWIEMRGKARKCRATGATARADAAVDG